MTYPVTVSFTFGGITTQAQLINLDADLANIVIALNGIGNGSSFLSSPIMGQANIGVAFVSNLALQNPLSSRMGGTGVTGPFTDGQLLIGSNTTGGLVAAALVPGAGITVTNTPGAVQISAAVGNFMNMNQQVFTASGTFTATANALHKFTVTGAGGGGGSISGSPGIVSGAGGGGGGGTAIYWANISTGTAITVAVGLPGGPVNTSKGTTGGNSAVIVAGTTISGGGGAGGDGVNGQSNATIGGGIGGTATNGTINITGQSGGFGYCSNVFASQIGVSGAGGASFFGASPGSLTSVASAGGLDGTLYGVGSAGCIAVGTNALGGNGGGGIVVVEWIQ